jgi:hypothetical protein
MSSAAWFVIGAAVGAGGLYALQQNMVQGAGPARKAIAGSSSKGFRPSPNADITVTSYRSSIKVPYQDMVDAFGEPHYTDDSDIASTYNSWTFEGPGGVWTVYDTDDVAPAHEHPDKVYHWRIGGQTKAAQFKKWLQQQLGRA